MKKITRSALALALVALLAQSALALTVGTFNIEYFNASGKKRYEPSDMQELAAIIRRSGADVLALQEIEGDATMRYFVTNALRGWKYFGNDTNGVQDLYFLWNPDKVTLNGTPMICYPNLNATFEGKKYKVFDRPPLIATFTDNETGLSFTMVDVHLKSQSTAGKKDKEEAVRYNDAKRAAQYEKLNELAQGLDGVAFILGDYNHDDAPQNVVFPLKYLKNGKSYDNMQSNLDFIGYVGIDGSELSEARETEGKISRRSTKKKEHPDHDIITIDVR